MSGVYLAVDAAEGAGDSMTARPGLIRTVIGGGLLFLAVSWGALALIMAMGGA